jgi:Matrixin
MRQLVIALLLVATMTWSSNRARAYTLQLTDAPNSVQVKWARRTIKIALSSSLNSPQTNIKAGSDVVGAVRRALRRWADAANIRFMLVSSNVQSVSAPGTRGDGLSLITIAHTAENFAVFAGEGSEMPGRTRVFQTLAGNITEADIVLNPGQPFSTDGTIGTYDLEATLTHEIGHLLGLEHSAVLGATMQPRQARNGIFNLPALTPRTLSDDDRAGVGALYGARLGTGAHGAIAGTLTFVSGAPVFGANVWAEEIETGRVVASNITLANGAYRIEGLRPGEYRLFTQSLNGTVAASEIASEHGAYAGLALNSQLPFQAEEIGTVSVKPNATIPLDAQLSGSPSLINPAFVGINRELSTVAVPLAAGQSFKVFLSGDGIKASQFNHTGGITATSPFIIVDAASVKEEDFGNGLSVISFDLMLAGDAPAGDYSLRLQSKSGEVAYVAGGLTIDEPENVADNNAQDVVIEGDDEVGAITVESLAMGDE